MKDIILTIISVLHIKIILDVSIPIEDLLFAILWQNIRIEGIQWI